LHASDCANAAMMNVLKNENDNVF